MAEDSQATRTEVRLVACVTEDDQIEVKMWSTPDRPMRDDFVQLAVAMQLALVNKMALAVGMGTAQDITELVMGAGPGDDGHDL